MLKILTSLLNHQLAVVVGAFVFAWLTGIGVSAHDPSLARLTKAKVIFVFTLEFMALAGGLYLIDKTLKLGSGSRGAAEDIGSFISAYGAVFVLFLLEYAVIVVSCGFKYHIIFKADPDSYDIKTPEKPKLLDWILYSAENLIPVEHGHATPISQAARVYNLGQIVGNLIISIFLIKFIFSLLTFKAS